MYPYCFDDLYPATHVTSEKQSTGVDVLLKASYPTIEICEVYCNSITGIADTNTDRSVYPYNLESIYPSVTAELSSGVSKSAVSVGVRSQYPVFEIC